MAVRGERADGAVERDGEADSPSRGTMELSAGLGRHLQLAFGVHPACAWVTGSSTPYRGPRCAGTCGRRRQHVDEREAWGHRERPDQLGAVVEEDRPGSRRALTVACRTGDRLPGTPRKATTRGAGVHAAATRRAAHRGGGDLTDVVPLVGQLPPGDVVRAVRPLADDDVWPRLAEPNWRDEQPRRRGHRRDQRDAAARRRSAWPPPTCRVAARSSRLMSRPAVVQSLMSSW